MNSVLFTRLSVVVSEHTIYIFCHSSLCPCRAGLLLFVLFQCRATFVVFSYARAKLRSFSSVLCPCKASSVVFSYARAKLRSFSSIFCQCKATSVLFSYAHAKLSSCRLSFVRAEQLLSSFIVSVQCTCSSCYLFLCLCRAQPLLSILVSVQSSAPVIYPCVCAWLSSCYLSLCLCRVQLLLSILMSVQGSAPVICPCVYAGFSS